MTDELERTRHRIGDDVPRPVARNGPGAGTADERPRVMTDGGCKYVNETGDGYVGIARVNDDNLCVRLSTGAVNWPVGTDVTAYEVEEGIALVPEGETLPGEPHANLTVSPGNGSVNRLNVSYSCIETLGVDHGADIRIYEREPCGLLLVDADADPRLG